MGYGVNPYAVRPSLWDGLRGKEAWLRHPARRAAAGNRFDDDDIPAALEQMISGSEYDLPGHVYWYALELLAEQNGDPVRNYYWASMPRPSELIDAVTTALARAGSPDAAAIVETVFTSGPPVDLPDCEDFPLVGYLAADEIPGAVATLDAVDLSAMDDELAAGVREIGNWLRDCRGGGVDRGLLTFLY